jgi:hypothetical protein
MIMIRLAIIGLSGRNPSDAKILDNKHLEWAQMNVQLYIDEVLNIDKNKIILVSGGSAWMDHVAIQLFIQGGYGGLELYLPSEFNVKSKKYKNTHEGRKLNELHSACQNKTGLSIFEELTYANQKNTNIKIVIKRGFIQRNTLIAKNCDHLLSFTFDKNQPSGGGTLDTWNKVLHENKLHISLNNI